MSGDPGNPNLNPGLNSCAAHPQGVLFYEVGPRIQVFLKTTASGSLPALGGAPVKADAKLDPLVIQAGLLLRF